MTQSPVADTNVHSVSEGAANESVAVLDRKAWVARAFYFDLLALAVLLLAGAGLAVDIFVAGHFNGRGGPVQVDPNFSVQMRLALEGLAFLGSFAWVAARLIKAGFRELPGAR